MGTSAPNPAFKCLILLLSIIFFIKIPIWPFIYWLIIVHIESSTSLSILLAGIVLKLGSYGLLRYLIAFYFAYIFFSIIGMIDVSLYGHTLPNIMVILLGDNKELVAYSSIAHMNLSNGSIFTLNNYGLLANTLTSFVHSLSTISLFLFMGLLISRVLSHALVALFNINVMLRLILLIMVLSNLAIPLSSNFIAEILSLISLASVSPLLTDLFINMTFIAMSVWLVIYSRLLSFVVQYKFTYYIYWYYLFVIWLVYWLGLLFIM